MKPSVQARPKEECGREGQRGRGNGRWVGGLGVGCGGGRLEGGVTMETHRGAGETVAVGGDDSTLAAGE